MRTIPRTRRYVSPGALTICRPLLCFDYEREAYVLRGIGRHVGPVLREERRHSSPRPGRYTGEERRAAPQPPPGRVAAGPKPVQAARPVSPAPSANGNGNANANGNGNASANGGADGRGAKPPPSAKAARRNNNTSRSKSRRASRRTRG